MKKAIKGILSKQKIELFNEWFEKDKEFLVHVIKKVMAYVECRRVAEK